MFHRPLPSLAAFSLALTLLPAAPALAEGYVSASGNIFCIMNSYISRDNGLKVPAVHCEISDFTPTLLQRPYDCQSDWGGSFSLSATGLSDMNCHGDTLRTPDPQVMQYGASVDQDGIRCEFSREGVTCTNLDGHGFFLSRRRQRLF